MSDDVLLRATGVRKAFGATLALDSVDLVLGRGEVHALVGENGAGKSTLMKILSGAHAADAGTITLEGRPFAPRSPVEAREQGVAMIYQELTLCPHLTVEQNVMLGREESSGGWLRRSSMTPKVVAALERLGRGGLPPSRRAGDLSPADQQVVEIARALAFGARVVVMDEPTSSLTRTDVARLFDVIRRLRADGVGVVYISHFLEEVREIADRFTVLRDGRTAGTGDVASTPADAMIEMMVGRRLRDLYPKAPCSTGGVVLRVEGIAGRRLPRSAGFELRSGEILGVAGLVGAGRTELLRAIFGLDPRRAGTVEIGGRAAPGAPAGMIAAGAGLLSEDRKGEGLALALPIDVNVTLSDLEPLSRLGWLSSRRRERATRDWMERLDIRARGPSQRAGELSGGNQQKVALARLLHQDAAVLLLDEPTRGIDVASKVEIYRLIGELASRGKAVVFVSSYLPELLGVCDRIAVMRRGALGAARPAAEWTEEDLLREATRGTAEAGDAAA
jgi:ribose transport system ATP-binding protein